MSEVKEQKKYNDGLIINLKEARSELDGLISNLESIDWAHDEDQLECDLPEIIWHLVAAWNARTVSLESMNGLPPEEFKNLGCKIPNFDNRFALVPRMPADEEKLAED